MEITFAIIYFTTLSVTAILLDVVLELLLSYTKRNIMLCSLCLTIPFVIFRLIPISSFGKYYDDEK
ncbi:hypothetical protein T12_186 [Trichinella patagoniensis]|uniref:Uncharacterized protein n=1 Tax=Trichinella patagoniensis TaxID=990121 RepID=A0A0V0ZHA0_9BILA|nr:hypothetical protein T12_186 [Trichinella patagoniensis]